MKKRKLALSDLTYDSREQKAILAVLRSRWLSMGAECQRFEKEFADYVGISFALSVANCTSALHLAFLALEIGSGDEVIVPSLTFVGTVNAIRYTRATPVFADITSLDDLNVSVADVEQKITQRTKAIAVVHYAGYPCDMDGIKAIAKKYRLYVIEDAAHGPGSYYKGRQIGTFGDIGCFSFFANKNLVTGEGGMVVTDNKVFAQRMEYLRSHGMTSLSWDRYKGRAYRYDVVALGYNYRFDEIRAALGRVQLAKLAQNNKKRAALNRHYLSLLNSVQGLRIPFRLRKERVSHHIFPVVLPERIDRFKLMDTLAKDGIQTSIHYPPVHKMAIYRGLRKDKLPLTETAARRELTLPMHPGLNFSDVEKIVGALKDAYFHSGG